MKKIALRLYYNHSSFEHFDNQNSTNQPNLRLNIFTTKAQIKILIKYLDSNS